MSAQRVPAWQRLGLKLKPAGSHAEALSTPSAPPPRANASFQRDNFESPKRKQSFGDSSYAKPSFKKPRTEDHHYDTPLRRQKSVTFSEGADSGRRAAAEPKKAKVNPKKKKKKAAKKDPAPAPPPDPTAALDYLRRWKTARDSWKFNKNLQAHLVTHVFDPSLFPAADVDTFYEYVCDLKGYVRTRLVEAAKTICTEDQEDGKDHFAAGTTDIESKEKEYQGVMSGLLEGGEAPKRKQFNEVAFAKRGIDPVVARRVAKRMRAEIIVEELDIESDASEATSGSGTTTTTADEKEPPAKEASEEPDVGKKAKLNDGTTRPIKRVRASKRRGADADDSSSSEDSDSDSDSDSSDDEDDESGDDSDSDSDSDSSSSSSSDSSDDSDDEMDVDAGLNDQDTSSSSSSSSDEESESDEESDDDKKKKKKKA